MRYEAAPRFTADWARLSRAEQDTFLRILRDRFRPACERFAKDPATPWPRSLRVKRIHGMPGIWEMTWSFAGPDGRATLEWVEFEGELAIRWRRLGGHEVFDRP